MSDINEKLANYYSIRQNASKLYAIFDKVRCPALGNEFVHFTAKSFNHLIYPTKNKPRDKRAQIMKFELLEKAKFIIEKSTTFQEYEEYFDYIAVKKFGKKANESTLIRLWGLIAIVKKF